MSIWEILKLLANNLGRWSVSHNKVKIAHNADGDGGAHNSRAWVRFSFEENGTALQIEGQFPLSGENDEIKLRTRDASGQWQETAVDSDNVVVSTRGSLLPPFVTPVVEFRYTLNDQYHNYRFDWRPV